MLCQFGKVDFPCSSPGVCIRECIDVVKATAHNSVSEKMDTNNLVNTEQKETQIQIQLIPVLVEAKCLDSAKFVNDI